jgi:hypothetical protein
MPPEMAVEMLGKHYPKELVMDLAMNEWLLFQETMRPPK